MTQTIVHFVDSATFGGTEQALLHLLAGLDRDRWRPVLFHHSGPGIEPLLEGARRLNVGTRAVPRMQGMRTISGLPRFLRHLRAEHPTVFHAHLNWLLSCKYGLVAAALARVPAIVATAQNYMLPPWGRTVYLQQQLVVGGVDRYIAVSHAVAQQLRETFRVPAGKLQVVHNSIPLAPFEVAANESLRASLGGATGRAIVLTVARLDEQKGHRYLLEAAALVPEVTFVLSGDGPERGALEAQAKALGLENRVNFLGYRRDVPALLASCDVFVLPSIYEGFPLSVLEAMAAGRPVVATAVGGTAEAVIHNQTGLLVPPADSAAIASAIRNILSDPPIARRLGAAGKARVHQEFSAEATVQRLAQAYEDLLDSREVLRA